MKSTEAGGQMVEQDLSEHLAPQTRHSSLQLKASSSTVSYVLDHIGEWVPMLNTLRTYERSMLISDSMAGLTIGIILIPQGLAYAQLAGLPPIWGLYCGLVPLIPFALLSPSPHISVGPFAIASLLTASALQSKIKCNLTGIGDEPECDDDKAYLEAATVLAFIVGVNQIALSMLRLGEVISRILSTPVTKAYCTACAFYIATSQIKNFLEVSVRTTNDPLSLFGAWYDVFSQLDDVNWHSLVFGAGAVVIMLFSKAFAPKLPIELGVVILGIVLCWALGFTEKMKIVGHFKGLPDFEIPQVSKYAADLWGHSVLITVLTYIISISIVKNFAMKHGYAVRGNGHLFALGVANLFGCFFQCYPASGSLSRSVALEAAGGKTTLSSIITIALLLLTLLFFTSLFKDLPKSILAAIIFVALKNLFKRLNEGWKLWKARHVYDCVVWTITLLGTLVLGMQYGIVVGMAASLVGLMLQLHANGALRRTFAALARDATPSLASCRGALSCCGCCSSASSSSSQQDGNDGDARRQSALALGLLEGVQKAQLGRAATGGLCLITYSFGLPLCFLNMETFSLRLVEALDAARIDAAANARRDDREEKFKTVIILDFQGIDFVDASALNMLEKAVVDMSSRAESVYPYFVACSLGVEKQLELKKIKATVGEDFFIATHTGAVSHATQEFAIESGPGYRRDPRLTRQSTYDYHLASPVLKAARKVPGPLSNEGAFVTA